MEPQRPLTKTEIVALLKSEGLRLSRRRGQTFLIDGNLLRVIADAPGLTDRDVVLEIGAGLGQLTRLLAERAGQVISVEVDAGFAAVLRRLLGDLGNVDLIEADALAARAAVNPVVIEAIERHLAARDSPRWRVVANPPYSIATPFILAALKSDSAPADLHVTLQQELAERLASAPGCKAYGPVTVIVQALARVEPLRRIPATAFWPRPAVDSALVRIVPDRALADRIRHFPTFQRLVAGLFQARRKTLHNALKQVTGRETADRLLAATGLAGRRRPEALAVAEFTRLANALPAP